MKNVKNQNNTRQKKCFITALCISLLIILGMYISTYDIDNGNVLKIVYYSWDTPVHLFMLRDNGEIEVSVGGYYNDIRKRNVVDDTVESAVKKITKNEFNEIIDLAEIAMDNKQNDGDAYALGALYVTVLYKNKRFEFCYGFSHTKNFERLIEKIVTVSPIEAEYEGEPFMNFIGEYYTW